MSAHIKTWYERLSEMSSEDGRYGSEQISTAHAEEVADLRAAIAQKEAAAPGDLHAAIMALPLPSGFGGFASGWKSGINAAAELTRAALAQPVAVDVPTCKCDLRTKLVGDGCAVCNPELARMVKRENADDALEDAIEGLEILDSLIGSIEEHGNYSKESTLNFLLQIKQCFSTIAAIDAQDGEAT